MVGGKYGQSLDLGSDLEKEKEAEARGEQPQLPCFCSPKPKKVVSEEDVKQEEAASEKQESEKQAEEPPVKESVPEEPVVDVKPIEGPVDEAQISDVSEKNVEELLEEEEPELPVKEPDPLEDDVNEIITKDIPQLQPRKKVFGIFSKKLFFTLFVVAIIVFLFVWLKTPSEPAVGQITAMPVLVPLENITGQSEAELPPEDAGIKYVDDLPYFFDEQLKD